MAILILCSITSFAQPQLSVNNYAPIESQGNFPADLKKAANTPKSAKEYNPFLVSMLNQGRVLYGTEMNQYLDNIKEKLLVNHPQLQQEVHVYILQNVTKDLIHDIFVKNKMRYIDFCDYPQGTTMDEIAKSGGDTTRPAAASSKYDRIKQQNMAKVLPDPKFKTVNYMLVDIHGDSTFRAWVNDAVVNAEMQAVQDAVTDTKIGDEKSVLVATPIYLTYNDNGRIQSPSAGKRNAEQLQKLMCRALKRNHITPVTISMDFAKPETEAYNNFAKMRQWNDDFTNSGGFFYRYKMDTEGLLMGIIEGTTGPYEEIIENKGNLFGMKLEYGYDFILLNRLKLTLGASIGTTFGGYQVAFARIKDRGSLYYEESTLHYDNYARSRILGAYCFGLKLGIGFIPF